MRMEEKIVLKLTYMYRESVEIEVSDPDKCTILDIFVDLLKGAEKRGFILPAHPSLWYTHESQSLKLETDGDILRMFILFAGKNLIKVAVGSSEKPCQTLELACGLIESEKSMEAPLTGSSLPASSSHGTAYLQSNVPTKKIPATSARRKGTYVPKGRSIYHSSGSQPTSGSLSRTKGMVETRLVDDTNVDAQVTDLPSVDVEDDIGLAGIDYPNESDASDVDRDAYLAGLYENGELYAENDFGKIELKEWMLFMNKDHFMDVMRDYCIQEGFYVVVLKVERNRYTAVCADEKCEWRIHSSRLADEVTWAIKSIKSIHTCLRVNLHNSMATTEWAANKILEHVRANEEITGKTINKLLFRKYGINLKPTSLYKARKLAIDMIRGDEDSSYSHLPTYCEVVQMTNPSSKAHCVWGFAEGNPERPIQFKSVFVSMKPMTEGFIGGCRGVIGVDGCHLKGKYGGVLLSAIALDGNNEIFPIAYGVYANESKTTWASFFHNLKEVLNNGERDNWTIVSDRQKGIEPALGEVWPTVSRRFCCSHLCANFKKAYPGKLMHDLFWKCCWAYSEFTFRKAMEKLQKEGGLGTVRWLQGVGPMECWARHKYDPSLHFPETTSNFVESFNSTLGVDRCVTILSLLEGIRRTSMVRHCERQEFSQNMPAKGITSSAQKKLDDAVVASRKLEVFRASFTEYEVKDGNSYLPVNIVAWTCACGQWQHTGIPCRHAVRAIIDMRGSPEEYVSKWFSVEMYRRTYSANYRPIPDVEQWPAVDLPKLIPPPMKRGVGRPTRNRRRREDEHQKGKRSRTVRCGRCKTFGHNTKTCKGGLTARELREQQGMRVERRKRRKVVREDSTTEQAPSIDDIMSSAPCVPGSQ